MTFPSSSRIVTVTLIFFPTWGKIIANDLAPEGRVFLAFRKLLVGPLNAIIPIPIRKIRKKRAERKRNFLSFIVQFRLWHQESGLSNGRNPKPLQPPLRQGKNIPSYHRRGWGGVYSFCLSCRSGFVTRSVLQFRMVLYYFYRHPLVLPF